MSQRLHKITMIGGTELWVYIREGEDKVKAAEAFCEALDMPSDEIMFVDEATSLERMMQEGEDE